MKYPLLILALAAVLVPVSCTSLDREGEKVLASVETTVSPARLRPALVEVFGRRGMRSGAPSANPMFFEGLANRAELFAYKDFGEFDQVIVERAHVDLVPAGHGTSVKARVQIISNPGTMFEDAKFPIVGMRKRYQKMLRDAVAIAGGATPGVVAPQAPRSSNYEVPLPLEGAPLSTPLH